MRVKGSIELAKKTRKSNVHSTHNEQQIEDNKKENINDFDTNNDDDTVQSCSNQITCNHINKSINFNSFKKIFKQQNIGECSSCSGESKRNKDSLIWLCLSCGFQGCDRSSEHQHALKHFQTPRSTLHCIVLNLDSFLLWCYECDEEICNYPKRVEEVVNFVKKMCLQAAQQQSGLNCGNEKSSNENIQIDHQQAIAIANTTRNNQIAYTKKQQQQQQQQQQNSNIVNSSTVRVKGLNNLGNTCFFNAVLQNLAQTPNIESILQEAINSKDRNEIIHSNKDCEPDTSSDLSDNDEKKDNEIDNEKSTSNKVICNRKSNINNNLRSTNKTEQLTISINDAGAMTYNLFGLIKEMNSLRSSYSLSPGALFNLVCKKVPSFKGFQQQDSHELLRHLLDAIKAEEIKRRQLGILTALNYKEHPADETIKQKIKNYGRLINYTCIDSLFGGHLLSTVFCEQCKTCSQNIEPFLDLSLPITDDKLNNNKAFVIDDNNEEHVSKNKIKKQKKMAKKTSKKSQKMKMKTNDDDASKQDKQQQQYSSTNNLNNTITDDEQEDGNEEENVTTSELNNYVENEVEEKNDSSKVYELAASLNDVLLQNDLLNHNFKLEAMKPLSRRPTPATMSSTTITGLTTATTILPNDDDNGCSLQSCLLKFTSPELLTGNNKFGCENCTRSFYRKFNSSANNLPKDMKTVYTQATKQYLICELPPVLTIHLKRFQQHGFRLEKVNKHVNFPLELDMSPYTSKMCTNLLNKDTNMNKVIYSLYGVVEHSGRLNGGHYTAYVKVRQKQNLEKILGKKKLTVLKPNNLSNSNNNLTNVDTAAVSDTMEATNALSNNNNINSTWYYISDSHVSEVPESKILKLQAYILFYERIM